MLIGDNVRHVAYAVGVQKGVTPLLKTDFISATTNAHLQFAWPRRQFMADLTHISDVIFC